jgi:hypothetical protein
LKNDKLYGMKVEDAGDSANLKEGQIVTPRELRDENSLLKRNDKNIVVARDVITATGTLFYKVLQELRYKQNHSSRQHLPRDY